MSRRGRAQVPTQCPLRGCTFKDRPFPEPPEALRKTADAALYRCPECGAPIPIVSSLICSGLRRSAAYALPAVALAYCEHGNKARLSREFGLSRGCVYRYLQVAAGSAGIIASAFQDLLDLPQDKAETYRLALTAVVPRAAVEAQPPQERPPEDDERRLLGPQPAKEGGDGRQGASGATPQVGSEDSGGTGAEEAARLLTLRSHQISTVDSESRMFLDPATWKDVGDVAVTVPCPKDEGSWYLLGARPYGEVMRRLEADAKARSSEWASALHDWYATTYEVVRRQPATGKCVLPETLRGAFPPGRQISVRLRGDRYRLESVERDRERMDAMRDEVKGVPDSEFDT